MVHADGGRRVLGCASCARGCLSLRMSRTGVPSNSWSILRMPDDDWSDNRRRAARTLPSNMSLAKALDFLSSQV